VRGPTSKNAVTGAARHYMKMQMLDKLACRPAVIAQDVVRLGIHSRSNRFGDSSQTRTDLAQNLTGAIVRLHEVLPGNHECMTIA
jgi:hypothetical protein